MYACIQTMSKVDGRMEAVNTWRRQPDVGVDRGEVLERGFHRDPLRLPLGPLSSCLTLSLLFAVSSSASLPLEIMKHVIKCLALFNHSNLVSHDIRFYLFTAWLNFYSKYIFFLNIIYFNNYSFTGLVSLRIEKNNYQLNNENGLSYRYVYRFIISDYKIVEDAF